MYKLLVVESPKKIKTLKNILSSEYKIASTVGHITKLKKVEKDNNYNLIFDVDKDKKNIVSDLRNLSKNASVILIATDGDREGEAIGVRYLETCIKGYNDNVPVQRVIFKSLTKNVVLEELKKTAQIDYDKVRAQEARRCIDRLMGFDLSLLIKKAVGSLSAGRVQSVALKLIVDRERERLAFKPEHYFEVFVKDAVVEGEPVKFSYWGEEYDSVKETVKKERINDKAKVNELESDFQTDLFHVFKLTHKERNVSPPKPLETSSLIRKANSDLNFSAKKTMFIAQQLYQGFNHVNDLEPIAWITYMRTDSIRIEENEQDLILAYLEKNNQEHNGRLKEEKSKKKSKVDIQDAHEAIRPSIITQSPAEFVNELGGVDSDHFKLYSLIWRTTLAAFMKPAIMVDNVILIKNKSHYYRTMFSTVKESNFYKVLPRKSTKEDNPVINKTYVEGEEIKVCDFESVAKQTQPPPRYTESSLIKVFKKEGIGRPSTYQSIFDKIIKQRGYVANEKKSSSSPLYPTEQGFKTSDFLQAKFNKWINEKYTSELEEDLDKIAKGERTYFQVVNKFYRDDKFEEKVVSVTKEVKDDSILDEKCPDCGSNLQKKQSKNGEFVGCSAYATTKCKYIKVVGTGEKCPDCGKDLVKRNGKYGPFESCSGYPECKYIKKKAKKPVVLTDVKCTKCGEGTFVERTGPKGKFYACNKFPKCRNTRNTLDNKEKTKKENKGKAIDIDSPIKGVVDFDD